MSERVEHEPGFEEVQVLSPGEVEPHESEGGELRLRLADGSAYDGVRVVPAFPISRPNRFVFFLDSEGKEIGVLVEPRRLGRDYRDLLLAHADQAYFMPRITRILRVDERMGIARWEVETDRGWAQFDVIARSESVWFVGRSRAVVRDADGNRYLIEDLGALDRRSRRLADLYL